MRNTIGIRRETVDLSERRAPLTPTQVREAVRTMGVRVKVEPSDCRVFRDTEYAEAGAEITGELSDCNVVFGIKEIPNEAIRPGGVYCYFSHTIKAQRYNMPMLAHILDTGATLLDYELVTNESGRRLIFFGNYAGYAGMIDALWALGRRLAWEGIATPFADLQPTHGYESLAAAETALADVGERIHREGLPPAITPFICLFTGRGHVARGAQEMFAHLPAVRVEPHELDALDAPGGHSPRLVYGVELRKPHLYAPRDTSQAFDLEGFTRDPASYRGCLDAYAPHATLLVHGIYWSPRFPRLLTRTWMRDHYGVGRTPRLRLIADITCDVGGSIESTVRATTAVDPVYVYDPDTGATTNGWAGRGPVVLAVDKLPTELPREATHSFGEALLPFVSDLAAADFEGPAEALDLPTPFRKAVIAHRGRLTEHFRYLNDYLLSE